MREIRRKRLNLGGASRSDAHHTVLDFGEVQDIVLSLDCGTLRWYWVASCRVILALTFFAELALTSRSRHGPNEGTRERTFAWASSTPSDYAILVSLHQAILGDAHWPAASALRVVCVCPQSRNPRESTDCREPRPGVTERFDSLAARVLGAAGRKAVSVARGLPSRSMRFRHFPQLRWLKANRQSATRNAVPRYLDDFFLTSERRAVVARLCNPVSPPEGPTSLSAQSPG